MTNSDTLEQHDRSRLLAAAERARSRRRFRRAIAFYRRVLATEPGHAALHGRLAPLLARMGQRFDAWVSFRIAARGQLDEGRIEQAIGTYRTAAECLPQEVDAWIAISRLERKRGRERDAVAALLKGRKHFRRASLRPQAIYLLRWVREIEPWNPNANLDLARLLAKSEQREEAMLLLEALAGRSRGNQLRRVRGAQWRIAPTLKHTWLWLRAAMTGGGRPRRKLVFRSGALSLSHPAVSRD